MIIGSNADEFRYCSLYYDDLDDIIFDWLKANNQVANAAAIDLDKVDLEVLKKKYYDLKSDMDSSEKAFQFAHDFLFRMPNIRMAELQSLHNDVWMYYFTWASSIDNVGAGHAVELAFVFHNLHRTEYTGDDQPVALADRIQASWAGFAAEGNPNHADIPEWEKYNTETRKTMLIGEDWFLASDFGRKERMLFHPYLENIENRSN